MDERENFGRFGAIMAMAGSAVGLGNLWRFPYLLGEYGGAVFLVVYLLCAMLIALPIFFAEFIVGRRSGENCKGAFAKLSDNKGLWKHMGFLGVLTCTIIFSFYSVIGGWCLQYFFRACAFEFGPDVSSEVLSGKFTGFITAVWPPLVSFLVFVLLTGYIVDRGVKNGIEKFGKVAMPTLAVIITFMAVFVAFLPGASEGYSYMFKPDFSKLNSSVLVSAMGQAFFSLSLGCGCIITFSSYVKKNDSILFHTIGTSLLDVAFALIAGCAIMPAVFAFGVNPGSGPTLVYETLPFIFSRMPAGAFMAILFFAALLFATFTSSVSMCEVGVAYLTEEKHFSRRGAVLSIVGVALVLGGLCSLSFGPLSTLTLFGDTIFDFCDRFSSNYLMTLGAMIVVLFVGWRMKRSDVYAEFTNEGTLKRNIIPFKIVYFLIRYVSPLAILVIFIQGILS